MATTTVPPNPQVLHAEEAEYTLPDGTRLRLFGVRIEFAPGNPAPEVLTTAPEAGEVPLPEIFDDLGDVHSPPGTPAPVEDDDEAEEVEDEPYICAVDDGSEDEDDEDDMAMDVCEDSIHDDDDIDYLVAALDDVVLVDDDDDDEALPFGFYPQEQTPFQLPQTAQFPWNTTSPVFNPQGW